MTDRKDAMPPLGDRITLAWNPNRGVHVMPSPPHNEAVMFRNYVSEKSHEAIVSALTAERDALKAKSDWAHAKLRDTNIIVGTMKRELRRNPVEGAGKKPDRVEPRSITNMRQWAEYWKQNARSLYGSLLRWEPNFQREQARRHRAAQDGEERP